MELRTYTLANADAQRRYTEDFWPRHIQSLRKYGITVHGVWTDATTEDHVVVALVGYRSEADPAMLAENYRNSRDFDEDHAFFDVSAILSTQTVVLEPIASSPLQ